MKNSVMACLLLALFVLATPANAEKRECVNQFILDGVTSRPRQSSGSQQLPMNPTIKKLAIGMTKTFACLWTINYYAVQDSLPDNIVDANSANVGDYWEEAFSSKLNPKICGAVRSDLRFDMFERKPAVADREAYKLLRLTLFERFVKFKGETADEAEGMIQAYLPRGKNFSRPTAKHFIRLMEKYQNQIVEDFDKFVADKKWEEGEVRRLLSLISCSPLLPESIGPDMEALAKHHSAFEVYRAFEADLDGWTK